MRGKYDILITVYNKEKYIRRCLESAINQNFNNYNIIIVNDGSTDSTEEIINEYLLKHDNIYYYYKENSGVADARNYAISKVTSPFFIFLDADDYLSLDLLKNVDSYCNESIDILSFLAYKLDEEKKSFSKLIKNTFTNINGKKAILNFCNSCAVFDVPWGYVYNTNFFKENNFQYLSGTEHEDSSLTPIIIATANKITSIDYFGYYYVQNPDSITHNKNTEQKRILDKFNHLKYLSSFYNSLDFNNQEKDVLNNKLLFILLDITTYIGQENFKFYIKQFKNMNMYEILPNTSKTNKIYRLFLKYLPKIPILFFLCYIYKGNYNKFYFKSKNFLSKIRVDGYQKYKKMISNPLITKAQYYYIMRIKRMLLFNKNILSNLYILKDNNYIFLETLELKINTLNQLNIDEEIKKLLKIVNHINNIIIPNLELTNNLNIKKILKLLIKSKQISNIIISINSLENLKELHLLSLLNHSKIILNINYKHKIKKLVLKKHIKIRYNYNKKYKDLPYLKYINQQLFIKDILNDNKYTFSNGKIYLLSEDENNLKEYIDILEDKQSIKYKKYELIKLLNKKSSL